MKDLIENGIDFNPALTPCLKTECPLWGDGECFYTAKPVRNYIGTHKDNFILCSSPKQSYSRSVGRFHQGLIKIYNSFSTAPNTFERILVLI
jgi:hypothetical protein